MHFIGSVAAGFFNVDPYYILWDKADNDKIQKTKYSMTLDFADLRLKGKYKVRDVWRQKDLGTVGDRFTTKVPYHGVTFVKLTPAE